MPSVQICSESRHRFCPWQIVLVILMLICLSNGIVAWNRVKRERDPRGRLATREEWPEKLHDFFQNANQKGVPVKHLEVYHGLRDDFFLKCDATPALTQLMTTTWKLSQVDIRHKAVQVALTSAPPAISSLQQNSETDYYVSSEYMPGGEWKGHLYCVTINKAEQIIVVRYYYNF